MVGDERSGRGGRESDRVGTAGLPGSSRCLQVLVELLADVVPSILGACVLIQTSGRRRAGTLVATSGAMSEFLRPDDESDTWLGVAFPTSHVSHLLHPSEGPSGMAARATALGVERVVVESLADRDGPWGVLLRLETGDPGRRDRATVSQFVRAASDLRIGRRGYPTDVAEWSDDDDPTIRHRASRVLHDAIDELGWDADALYVGYFGVGGDASRTRVAMMLDDPLALSQWDYDTFVQALNDECRDRGLQATVPFGSQLHS